MLCPIHLWALDYLFEWVFQNHCDRMRVEILLELPFGDQHGINEVRDPWVAGLGIEDYVTDEVNRSLHFQHFVRLITLDN
jgi:hypothetical protein